MGADRWQTWILMGMPLGGAKTKHTNKQREERKKHHKPLSKQLTCFSKVILRSKRQHHKSFAGENKFIYLWIWKVEGRGGKKRRGIIHYKSNNDAGLEKNCILISKDQTFTIGRDSKGRESLPCWPEEIHIYFQSIYKASNNSPGFLQWFPFLLQTEE